MWKQWVEWSEKGDFVPTIREVLNRLLIRNAGFDSEETRIHVFSQAVHQSPKQWRITNVISTRLTIRVASRRSITRPYQPRQNVV